MSDARIVTILFTDLVASTELADRLGDEAADEVRRTHFGLLREAVQSHGGEEVKNVGDGLMVVFASAAAAVACAVDMQRAIERHNRRPATSLPLGVRVGLHVGEPTREEDDYFGGAVNVAARLCAAAEGGQILASDLVRGLARGRTEATFTRLDSVELKGLSEPVEPYEVVWSPVTGAELPLPSALTTPVRTPYVGRSELRTELEQDFKQAVSGERKIALLAGEPGIGKTRLSTELARSAHERGAIILYGRCDEDGVVPYQPFVEALRFYVAHAPAADLPSGGTGADLARLIPELRERVSDLPEPARSDPEGERYGLFRAVGQTLAEIARAAPLFLLLDDLHWADRPTVALLKHVIRDLDESAAFVCGTYRDVDLSRGHPFGDLVHDLRRDRIVRRVRLRGLGEPEVVGFLEAVAAHELDDAGLAFAHVLSVETDGNPFFLEEILANLIETGRLYTDEHGRWTSDATSVEELGIPEGIREAVGRRLARLTEEANEALAAASVLGPRFEFSVLERMTDVDAEALAAAIEGALRAQLVIEHEDAGRAGYTFAHAMVRQVLYEELSLPRRQRLHLKAAQALEAEHPSEPPLGSIATHYRAAGAAADPQKAIDFSLLAGQQAAGVYAFEEALRHLEEARALMEEHGTPPDMRARLLGYLGDLRYVTGLDYDRGLVALEEAVRIYEELGDEVHAAQMRSRLGRSLSSFVGRTDIDRSLEEFRTAERVLVRQGPGPALGYTYVGLASASLWALRTSEGLEAAERAVEVADEIGQRPLAAISRGLRGWFLCVRGGITEGLLALEEAYEVADALDHAPTAFFTSFMRGFLGLALMDPGDALRWFERELARPRNAAAPHLAGYLRGMAAQAGVDLGRLDVVERMGAAVRELGQGAAEVASRVREHEGRVAGDWGLVHELCLECAQRDADAGNWIGRSGYTWGAVQHELWNGEPGAAEARVRGLLEIAAGDVLAGVAFRCSLAEALAGLGRGSEAREALDRARERLDPIEAWRGQPANVAKAEGVVAAAVGDLGAAVGHFEQAREIARRFSHVWKEQLTLWSWARALRDAGEVRAAGERFDELAELYRRHGFGQPYFDRIEAERP